MDDQRGFTLIEIMVALAVFSLAALALIRLEGATIRGAVTIEDTMMARIVASNVAIDAQTAAVAPVLGRTDGVEPNGGRAWRWRRQVSATGNARIVRIDVGVLGPGGRLLGRAVAVRRAGVGG